MIPEHEALLMATGLLKLPDKTSIRAARSYEKEILTEFKAALRRENQGRLYAIQAPRNYYDRLYKFVPEYGPTIELLGPETGALYQIGQSTAAQVMANLYPKVTVETVLGPKPVEASEMATNLYVILADTVEDYLRLVHDFAGGVLIPQQVDLYQQVYPDAYQTLRDTLADELAKLGGADPDWLPPLWLSDMIRILRKEALGTFVRMDTPPQTPTPPTGTPGKLKLDDLVKAAETPSSQ